ncbi:S-adenosyl-L-methionine-dependent methyltransferase [Wallemia mellicola]|uniref:S-adenosyl-L-methionine-dependent methyltransferase n=1 Tax=Wallemia mellicola TaxID=1708541 RepID=A0A4T0MEQ8_9BASI|nr:S-adenosyl-L-methionine-dependent methyltransferase [Wallemia mellicola]
MKSDSIISSLIEYSLSGVARNIILSYFESITIGKLLVADVQNGCTLVYPSDASEVVKPSAKITVKNATFWIRLLLSKDLGFSEAFIFGDIDVDDLTEVFKVFLLNRRNFDETPYIPSKVHSILSYAINTRFMQNITNTRSLNIIAYEDSSGFFQTFLSKDMSHSCGIYQSAYADKELAFSFIGSDNKKQHKHRLNKMGSFLANGDAVNDGDDLHNAQLRKMRTIIRKSNILPNMRLLEIGWGGSFAIEMCSQYPSLVIDTLTVSITQKELAEEAIRIAGYTHRIRIHLCDYKNMPLSWKSQFDRVISIEMIESISTEQLPGYFECIDWALNDHGIGIIQSKTIPEARYKDHVDKVDFIRKYTGEMLPSLTSIFNALHDGTKGALIIDNIMQIGPHYARTFRDWKKAFLLNFDQNIKHQLDSLTDNEVKSFKRKWIYYFTYCEAGFETRTFGNHIITMTRESNNDMINV